jgi:hypothetical protein
MTVSTRIALLTAGVLASSGCSSASGPGTPEPFDVTSANALAALAFASGFNTIPPSCGTSPVVNCPGGIAGAPIPVALTVTKDSVARRTGADSLTFNWSADVKVVSPGIPITIPIVGSCTAMVDTRPGADSTVHVTGTLTFTRQTALGPIDRVDIAGQNLTGMTASDVSLSGSFGCTIADLGISFYTNLLSGSIFPLLHLCSAPGPLLFKICQEP